MSIKWPVILAMVLLFVGIILAKWFRLYSISHFDTALHFVGGFLTAWLVMAVLSKKLKYFSKVKIMIFVLGLSLMVGLAWEVAEHISGRYGQEYFPVVYDYFYAGNLRDTIADLFADLSGAFIFVLIFFFLVKSSKIHSR